MHRPHPSFRPRALLAAVPVAGLILMGTVGTASAAHTPANSQTALRLALQRALAHWHPTNHAIKGVALKQIGSRNWSGYADTGTGFSSVTGAWAVPKVTGCSATGPDQVEIFWVGLDGFKTQTVEQAGTGVACGRDFGPLVYFTWWELFPKNGIQAVGGTVKPGDKISASVVRSGTKYTFKVTDSTHSSNSFTKSTTCASSTCKNTSAEWIAERAALTINGVTHLSPLPNFGTWTLSKATVKAGSKSGTIKTFPDNQITMFNKPGGHVLAKPGPLNSAGNSFKDVWKASS